MSRRMFTAALISSLVGSAVVRAADPAKASPSTQPHAMMFDMRAADPFIMTGARTEKAAWLGVSTSRPPLALLKQLKIKTGLVVDEVRPGSPAEAAGIKAQDIIQRLDDQILINPAQLEGLVRMHAPGDSIGFTLLHEGDHATVTAKLVEHDVLAMQDVDPQTMGAVRMYKTDVPPGFTMKLAEGNSVDVNPVPIVLPPGMNGDVHVMTSVSKSVVNDDGTSGAGSFESQYSDGKHQLTMVRKGATHILTIKDGGGKQLFEGPVDTTQQQDSIPKDVLPTFREMQKLQNMTDDVAKPEAGR